MISELLDQFDDEIAGARRYRTCASEYPELTQMYESMMSAEVDHARMLWQAIGAERSKERTQEENGALLNEMLENVMKATRDRLAEFGR